MKDKIIVITGATRGLGLRLKEDLSKDNVVVTLSRSEVENGKTAFRADVSDFDDVKRVFDEIGKIYGKIDVLINNAGYGLSGATEIMRKEEIERITNVNFLGAIWCTKCALPYMTKGAKIAMISSASGLTPMPFRTMYNSTKAALTMFSYSMKLELCNLGIDCTAFILGPVNTGFSNNRTVVTAEDSRYFKDVKEVDDFVKNQDNSKKTSTKKSIGLYNKKTWKNPPSISLYRRIRFPPCLRILQIFPVHDLPPYQLFHAKTRKIKHHPSTDGLFFCRKPSIFLGHIVFILFPFRAIRHKLRF